MILVSLPFSFDGILKCQRNQNFIHSTKACLPFSYVSFKSIIFDCVFSLTLICNFVKTHFWRHYYLIAMQKSKTPLMLEFLMLILSIHKKSVFNHFKVPFTVLHNQSIIKNRFFHNQLAHTNRKMNIRASQR